MDQKPFKCTLTFTGICAVVLDPPLEKSPKKLWIVIVDGWYGKKIKKNAAIDDADLFRHGAVVHYDLKNRFAGYKGQSKGIWYPSRHQIEVKIEEYERISARATNDFDIDAEEMKEHLALMEEVVKGFSDIDPACLGPKPPANVLARLDIDKGKVGVAGYSMPGSWEFPWTVSGKPVNKSLAYQVVVEFSGIKLVKLIATPFQEDDRLGLPYTGPGTNEPEKVELFSPDGKDVNVTIANSCDDNPLIWETEIDLEKLKDDQDFKWHYELLAKRKDLKKFLKDNKRKAPFPIYRKGPQALAQGRNCFPALFTKA